MTKKELIAAMSEFPDSAVVVFPNNYYKELASVSPVIAADLMHKDSFEKEIDSEGAEWVIFLSNI